MISNLDSVHDYFRNHLQRQSWLLKPPALQIAAVTMAEQDVQNYRHHAPLDTTDALLFSAICEQAIFLAERYSELENGENLLKSEAIDGVGSRSFYESRQNSGVHSPQLTWHRDLAPRAALFLAAHRDGGVSFARG